jgi:hypothetical protein
VIANGPLVIAHDQAAIIHSDEGSPMSATKNFLHDYSELHDSAWCALEEAIVAMNKLNDLMFAENGEMRSRSPKVDVILLRDKVKELSDELACFASTEEPRRMPPVLPFEKVHYEM